MHSEAAAWGVSIATLVTISASEPLLPSCLPFMFTVVFAEFGRHQNAGNNVIRRHMDRIHKQYAPIFLVDACALFLIALEIIIGGAMEKSFNNMASEALIALVATLVVMVLDNLVVVVLADRSARK